MPPQQTAAVHWAQLFLVQALACSMCAPLCSQALTVRPEMECLEAERGLPSGPMGQSEGTAK